MLASKAVLFSLQKGLLVIRLTKSLAAWGAPEFPAVLKQEIQSLGSDALPLQQGLACSSYATDTPIQALILRVEDAGEAIRVKAGVFYAGIIAGCSCADDPTPVEENTEYCELRLEINKATAETTVALWQE